jgi:cyclopropane-fatty-acyl-phospholipid synthase
MKLIPAAIGAIERLPIPDAVTRAGIGALVSRTQRKLARPDPSIEQAFAAEMAAFPIAAHVEAANNQHYEVPAAFFALCLGPRRKYSCCHYAAATTTLAEAEVSALEQTCAHAELADGQRILELGCGWGSLTLWMAEHYPNATITAVSNSHSQRAYILAAARNKGFDNVDVVTADMNVFDPRAVFDRIVSVEMFEHMSNWRALLARTRQWLTPDGLLFIHIFTHAHAPYRFDHDDEADWIARHFFTGGIMPSQTLIEQFGDLYTTIGTWRWNGTHYARTARDWLANCDRHAKEIEAIFAEVYGGRAARLWLRRWRLFYLATEGLFGHAGGEAWGVQHYLLKPAG